MNILRQGTMVLSDNPRTAADFYVSHLGFEVAADLEWFVSLNHADLPALALDFMARDHPANAAAQVGVPTSGILLAFVIGDVDAAAARLVASGVRLTKPPATEPWGQRRLQIAAPDNVMVELVQIVPPDPEWLAAQSGFA